MKILQDGCFGAERHTNKRVTPYPKMHRDDESDASMVGTAAARTLDAHLLRRSRSWGNTSLVPMDAVPPLMGDCQ